MGVRDRPGPTRNADNSERLLGRAREAIHALERYEALHYTTEPCLEPARRAAFDALGIEPLPSVHPLTAEPIPAQMLVIDRNAQLVCTRCNRVLGRADGLSLSTLSTLGLAHEREMHGSIPPSAAVR